MRQHLVSEPTPIEEEDGWRGVHLPTQPDHFPDVQRLEFAGAMNGQAVDRCHVLNLEEMEIGRGRRGRRARPYGRKIRTLATRP